MRQKILFISHEASITGAPIFLSNFLQYLQTSQTSYDIKIHCANTGPLVKKFENTGFEVTTFYKNLSHASNFSKLFNRLKYYVNYVLMLRRLKPDLIYSNSIVNFSQVILGRLLGIKTLVHMHEGSKLDRKSVV